MFDRSEIREGMKVRTIDGQKLGHVLSVRGEELIVEKGLFSHKDFAVSLEDVREVAHGEVFLSHGPDSLFAAPKPIEPPEKHH